MQKMQGTWVLSLGQEDPLEKEMATRSSVLAYKIPLERCLVGYSSWGCKESDATEPLTHLLMYMVTGASQTVFTFMVSFFFGKR